MGDLLIHCYSSSVDYEEYYKIRDAVCHRFIFCDFSGQTRLYPIISGYMESMDAAILVVDASDPSTLRSLSEYYLPELHKYHSDNFPLLFVLNKIDCTPQLKKQQLAKLAKGLFSTVLVGSSSIGKGRNAVNGLIRELMDILRQSGKGDDLCTLFR